MKKIIALLPAYLMIVPSVLAYDINVPRPQGVQYVEIGLLISNIISVAMVLAGLVVFAFLVWGGVQWITSGGDKAGVESARNRITAALIGLVIVGASYAVMRVIEAFFGTCIISCPIRIPGPQ
jgi:hypothetical protein